MEKGTPEISVRNVGSQTMEAMTRPDSDKNKRSGGKEEACEAHGNHEKC